MSGKLCLLLREAEREVFRGILILHSAIQFVSFSCRPASKTAYGNNDDVRKIENPGANPPLPHGMTLSKFHRPRASGSPHVKVCVVLPLLQVGDQAYQGLTAGNSTSHLAICGTTDAGYVCVCVFFNRSEIDITYNQPFSSE